MSDRLNERNRKLILGRVIDHAFGKEEKALEAEWGDLAEACYQHRYPKSVRERMEALPKGWLPESEWLEAAFGGMTKRLNFPDGKRRIQERHDGWGSKRLSLKADHKLSKRFDEIKRREKNLFERRIEAEAQVRAALKSVATIKKLRKEWPEIAPFTKGLGDSPLLPALRTDELNTMLNLGASRA